jgi:hypothetical protein
MFRDLTFDLKFNVKSFMVQHGVNHEDGFSGLKGYSVW